MFDQLHENNLLGIKGAVGVFDDVYFHGDGNIYNKKSESDNRQKYSNDPNGESSYRIHYKKGDNVPSSLEELKKALLESKNKETIESRSQVTKDGIPTFKVEIPLDKKDSEPPKDPNLNQGGNPLEGSQGEKPTDTGKDPSGENGKADQKNGKK